MFGVEAPEAGGLGVMASLSQLSDLCRLWLARDPPYSALPAATQSCDYSFIALLAFRVEHKSKTSSAARSSVHFRVAPLSLSALPSGRPVSTTGAECLFVRTSANPGALW